MEKIRDLQILDIKLLLSVFSFLVGDGKGEEARTKGQALNKFLQKSLFFAIKLFIPINSSLFAMCIMGHWQNWKSLKFPFSALVFYIL